MNKRIIAILIFIMIVFFIMAIIIASFGTVDKINRKVTEAAQTEQAP